jgi:hypothetical protein
MLRAFRIKFPSGQGTFLGAYPPDGEFESARRYSVTSVTGAGVGVGFALAAVGAIVQPCS